MSTARRSGSRRRGARVSSGFALVHQELSLVPELSVAENMFLGREARSKILGFIDRRATERRAGAILQEVEADISPRDRVGSLSLAKQQLVEIAKGISTDPRVLILDEPTSSLTQPEIDDLFRVVALRQGEGRRDPLHLPQAAGDLRSRRSRHRHARRTKAELPSGRGVDRAGTRT